MKQLTMKITTAPSTCDQFPIYQVTSCSCPDGSFTHVWFKSYDRTKCVEYIKKHFPKCII